MSEMKQNVGYFSVLVRDCDEATAYYCGVLGFQVVEDAALGGGHRRDLLELAKATRR